MNSIINPADWSLYSSFFKRIKIPFHSDVLEVTVIMKRKINSEKSCENSWWGSWYGAMPAGIFGERRCLQVWKPFGIEHFINGSDRTDIAAPVFFVSARNKQLVQSDCCIRIGLRSFNFIGIIQNDFGLIYNCIWYNILVSYLV